LSPKKSTYLIAYKSLKDGDFNYNWSLGDDFQRLFEKSDILQMNLTAEIHLKKSPRILQFTFFLKGMLGFECDRCLDKLEVPVDSEHQLVFKIEGPQNNFEEEILYLGEDEHELDLAPFLYESLVFAIPARKVHGEDANGKSLCNPAMTEKLNKLLVKEEDKTDPRWNELGKLLNN
jgi:uncharacterized metal-binding protein YceD (DUF177 family)